MLNYSKVQLVTKGSEFCTSTMFEISPSKFSQSSFSAKSLASPPYINRLEPSETTEVRDSLCALEVLSYGSLCVLVTFSLTLPFFESLTAYFDYSSSREMSDDDILDTVCMRSCECNSKRRYFLNKTPRSATALLLSSGSQIHSLKKGFINLAITSPLCYLSMKIMSQVIRYASFPSCRRKTSALTRSVSILVNVLLQRVVLEAWRCARYVERVKAGLSITAQVWMMIEQRLLAWRVCESTSCTMFAQRYCLNLLSCITSSWCCSEECAVISLIMN